MKVSKFLFNLSALICFLFGALYIFSLVFIPIGIYCFIAAKRFRFKAENMLNTMLVENDSVKNYAIFASIACFPFGLLSVIAYMMATSNNVRIEETEEVSNVEISAEKTEEKKEEPEQVEAYTEETEEEKLAKFEKLKKFHEKGIITDDELETARVQLFGKNEKE